MQPGTSISHYHIEAELGRGGMGEVWIGRHRTLDMNVAVKFVNSTDEQVAESLLERFRREAVSWAKQHPGRVLQLVGIKFLRMWNVWPNTAAGTGRLSRIVFSFSYLPLMGLALWGVWRHRTGGWGICICLLPAVYFTLLHVIFVSSLRYRQPAMLPLLVLAAAVLGSWFLDKEVHDEQICSATS